MASTVYDNQAGSYVGKPMKRREDSRLLKGQAQFLDDIKILNLHHVAFLRSPHAHARIVGIDASQALALDGVVAVFTGEDLYEHVGVLPLMSNVYPGVQKRENPILKPQLQRALAYGKVRYAGEALAAVVATSRAIAEDACQLIRVEYEPLPAVTNPLSALGEESPLLFEEWGDNIAVSYKVQTGNVEDAIQQADFVLRERFKLNRQSGNPMETRGVIADWDKRNGTLTVWSSTQMPHLLRSFLSECLHFPENRIRVVAPDVGGGFGPKALIYPEEIAMAYMSKQLQMPLKWVEDRLEHMMSTAHARDQQHEVEVGYNKDGVILGLRDKLVLDTGAFNLYGVNTSYNTAAHLPGPYRLRNYECDVKVVVTNKAPCSQYRGAGRPEAVFVMDRVVDLIASQLQLDPAEVRRRNMITPEEMPYDTGRLYKDGQPLIYDSGDYPKCFQMTLDAIGYDEFRRKQKEWWEQGRYVGIGLSAYVEGTGQGPHDGCRIVIDTSGDILCTVSTASQGQGHETTWAQICADHLGVDVGQVRVITGDTNGVNFGSGTYGSRSAVVGGSAIVMAAKRIKEKAVQLAAHVLKVLPEELDVGGGRVFVKNRPEVAVSFAELAKEAKPNRVPFYSDIEPGLQAEAYFIPSTATYSNGVHAAIVEVDIETGFLHILKYVVAHDAGKVINPMIADGQTMGGLAQGIGGAIYEEILYNENGQLLTGTYMDYLLPTASEVPPVTMVHMESPSPRNPLGVKGIGEGGTISPPAALANAVEDALRPLGVKITTMPLSPQNIWNLTREKANVG